ncbi:proline-rich receptor-like protein kinase PERK2 [Benincasa hispida]|uniref:proline-rich receptor-like protein kinase PERK2 n=1 Tax=Benincasa hispida TaxID=102211 RepID=UPI001900F1EF|nr:proline-rich receptor-like protein kinase PERK2 [Benincasa hispida]
MERPLTTLIFVISGFAFSVLSLLVESQTQDGANPTLSPPIPSPPPPSPPPPPPPLSPLPPPPPPPPPPPILSPPPPPLSPSPPPFSPPPPFPSPLPPRRRPPPFHASENGKKSPPVPPKNINNTNQGSKRSLNKGKKVGLFFVGIAAVLQICVVGFLVFKRRQLLRVKDRYEGFS